MAVKNPANDDVNVYIMYVLVQCNYQDWVHQNNNLRFISLNDFGGKAKNI